MLEIRTSTCRMCMAYCPIDVTLDDGRVVAVGGNRRAPLYGGFICPKGRTLPQLHAQPGRLMHSLKRMPDGSYQPIATEVAIEEIAERLRVIIAEDGPRAVSAFIGSAGNEQHASAPMMAAFMRAIGSPMVFSIATLDQPGLMIADALHGTWEGGRMRPETLDAFLLIGGNPIVSKQYFGQNPGQRLKELQRQGMQLIVIDPRTTETARRAAIHLKAIPGEDATILAGLIHLLIVRGGVDSAFVEADVSGLQALADAVSAFTPDYVAARAGVGEADLVAAADILARARTGDTGPGTGMSFASRGSLTSYLVLCLQTIRGFWAREGQEYVNPPVLGPPIAVRAQAIAPRPAMGGENMRVRGLQQSVAGLPGGAFAEEILTPGKGRVRASFLLISGGLNLPQQALSQEALESLDLLVTHDVESSPTARLAHYVIATKLQLELPIMTFQPEMARKVHHGYGWAVPYGAYRPAVIDPPAGADVIDVWRLYYRLGQRFGLPLSLAALRSADTVPLDMEREPTTEQVFEALCTNSAVPLSEVAKHPDGHVFDEARVFVGAKDRACTVRLRLDDPDMLAELAEVRAEDPVRRRGTDADYPFQLVARRVQNSTNAFIRVHPPLPGVETNPAYMHPEDMAEVGAVAGELVELRSRWGRIEVVAEVEPSLRRGVVALTHGFGRNLGEPDDPRKHGANVNRLTHVEDGVDHWTGMPRLGAIAIAVTARPGR
ncbi:molybdopterin-containing oxidoreductase family protein [Sphingomonas sp. M1-B02]|uniref:molybdopterin-containing oxidoreductase family protein n=1 Tax=Sphingomonas sp. M1-B02 TaxID=3114300 RepID=UPI00223FA704|nr:molybdopterin dinucleotide binding domain-containing protein [Sphingomonas sp. S6-11]UZK67304.1 molybdopterin-dependent oxidoreductase [Sphingomonas sp. S6-11]